jgi:hypothetical protein
VAAAHAHYKMHVQDQDWGSVRVYRVPTDGPVTYAVRVTTDGDDGYLEVYDEGGTLLVAGRTSVEAIAWGSRDWVRAQEGKSYPRIWNGTSPCPRSRGSDVPTGGASGWIPCE